MADHCILCARPNINTIALLHIIETQKKKLNKLLYALPLVYVLSLSRALDHITVTQGRYPHERVQSRNTRTAETPLLCSTRLLL